MLTQGLEIGAERFLPGRVQFCSFPSHIELVLGGSADCFDIGGFDTAPFLGDGAADQVEQPEMVSATENDLGGGGMGLVVDLDLERFRLPKKELRPAAFQMGAKLLLSLHDVFQKVLESVAFPVTVEPSLGVDKEKAVQDQRAGVGEGLGESDVGAKATEAARDPREEPTPVQGD